MGRPAGCIPVHRWIDRRYLSAYLSDAYGRRTTVIIAALLFIAGAGLSGIAQDLYVLTFARSLIGMGIGLSSMAGPQYVSEIAPRKIRGRLLGAFQFMISFGVLIGYLTNLITLDLGYSAETINRWQFMFLLSAIPGALLLYGIWSAPESPRWLVMANRSDEARTVFARIEPKQPEDWAKANVKRIEEDLAEVADQKGGWLDLFNSRNRPITSFTVITFLFQQLSGINASSSTRRNCLAIWAFPNKPAGSPPQLVSALHWHWPLPPACSSLIALAGGP